MGSGCSSQALQALRFLEENYSVTVQDILAGGNYTFPASSIMVNRRSGTRTIVNAPRSFYPASIDFSGIELEDHRVILLDGHYLEPEIRDHITEARSQGSIIVMDGGSWKKDSELYLDLVDYIICSTKFTKPGIKLSDMPSFLHNSGIGFVAYSDNEKPILVSENRHQSLVEVEQIDAIDTLGAGDVLHGAFCHFLVQGHAPLEAVSLASKIATESCRHFGTHHWQKSYSPAL